MQTPYNPQQFMYPMMMGHNNNGGGAQWNGCYCYTHGYKVNGNHWSGTCNRPGNHHNWVAVNHLVPGGSKRGVERLAQNGNPMALLPTRGLANDQQSGGQPSNQYQQGQQPMQYGNPMGFGNIGGYGGNMGYGRQT